MPDRRSVEAWWRAPVASIVLVAAGLVIIGVEVWRGENADAGGYTAGLALVGLGVTGRITSWIRNGTNGINGKKAEEKE